MPKFISSILFRLIDILSPRVIAGGLEISDSEIHYAGTKGEKLVTAITRLAAGIIKDGKVVNSGDFKKALEDVHLAVSPHPKKKIPVILNIPDNNIYTQVFFLPLVASANIEEAAVLNLRVITPIDFESAYSDWQMVGENNLQGGQLEILGAAVYKEIVDNFSKALKEANFEVVAIEFPALALSRLATGSLKASESPSGIILLRLTSNGFSFSLINDKKLYFNHSTPWETGSLYLARLESLITKETQRVLNFSTSHSRLPVKIFTLLCPNKVLEEKIITVIKKNFPLEVVAPETIFAADLKKVSLSSLASEWFAAFGSAVRGSIPRHEDDMITLASTDTQEDFKRSQLISFVRLWRNVSITVLMLILLIFGGAEIFLYQISGSLSGNINALSSISAINQELVGLKAEASKFNSEVSIVTDAKSSSQDLIPLIQKINNMAGSNVFIDHLSIQSVGSPVILSGRGKNAEAVIVFKNTLENDPQFGEVNLPLSQIVSSQGGLVNFSLSFKLNTYQ